MGAPTKKKSSKPKKVEIKTFTVEEELLWITHYYYIIVA
jgi:hypothetical protein